METTPLIAPAKVPWNKGKLIGQKAPFKLKDIWAIRIQLQLAQNRRDLALFNLAVDSKHASVRSRCWLMNMPCRWLIMRAVRDDIAHARPRTGGETVVLGATAF